MSRETPTRWAQIEDVYTRVIEGAPSSAARATMLDQLCGADTDLRRSVESLLSADPDAGHFLEDTALDVAADLLASEPGAPLIGQRLGAYTIDAWLGSGGMGDVYRARDEHLQRQVALKILPRIGRDASTDAGADRLARFKQEAQVLASLNHPNIAGIYGFEVSDGICALALELVEGPTLADRLAHGPVPLDEALVIARQIAEAIEAAHERGIVHRDLKPSNIALGPDATVKVLDFGLATVLLPENATSTTAAASTASPGPGLVGTPAYVSPEQARGRVTDKRVDVWAFGAVLYELLTGQRAFKGDRATEVLNAVLHQNVDWSALPPPTPAAVRRLLARCLERDVKRRLRDIGEARIVLEGAGTAGEVAVSPAGARPRAQLWFAGVIALGAGVLGAAAAWALRPATPPAITRLAFSLPADAGHFANQNRSVIAISPDGTQVVYVTPSGLHLRSLSGFDAQLIRGSEGIFNITEPTFSLDGRSIVFHTSADQTLRRLPVAGGTAVILARAAYPWGLNWGPDGIVFVEPIVGRDPRANRIMRVSPDGGVPEVLIELKEGEAAHGPQLLPGGRQLLYTLTTGTSPDRWDHASIVVQSLGSGERKTLIDGGSDARYVPTGHLVYAVRGSLLAVAFDLKQLEVRSTPVSVVEGVRRAAASSTGGAHFAFAANGTLVYLAGPVSPNPDVVLTHRTGDVQRLGLPPHHYEAPRVSPDGTRIVVGTDDAAEAAIWMYHLSGAGAIQRVTFAGNNRFPVWSSDGIRVAFQSDREGDAGIFWQRADGGGTPERLTRAGPGESHEPEAWSPTEDVMLFSTRRGPEFALWMLSLKDRMAMRFGDVRSSTRTGAVFSPDGRWVAYAATQGGNTTIYVQPFPATGSKYQITVNETKKPNHPLWSPDGTVLFYNPGPGEFASVSVSTEPTFAFGKSSALVARPFAAASTLTRRPYDITPDGTFVSAIADGSSGGGSADEIRVVLNWFEDLRARVPTAK